MRPYGGSAVGEEELGDHTGVTGAFPHVAGVVPVVVDVHRDLSALCAVGVAHFSAELRGHRLSLWPAMIRTGARPWWM